MIEIPNKASFRIDEAANLFGVSSRTIRNMIEREDIKACVKVGGSVRIPRQALIDCQRIIDPLCIADVAA
jgi:excisionase family DNA binding protein